MRRVFEATLLAITGLVVALQFLVGAFALHWFWRTFRELLGATIAHQAATPHERRASAQPDDDGIPESTIDTTPPRMRNLNDDDLLAVYAQRRESNARNKEQAPPQSDVAYTDQNTTDLPGEDIPLEQGGYFREMPYAKTNH